MSPSGFEQPWTWKRAAGGWSHPNDPKHEMFHAYDVNDGSACVESLGLAASSEEPNEGSQLCPLCIDVVRAMPAGRRKRLPIDPNRRVPPP